MLAKAISLFLLSSVKFIFAFPLAYSLHFSFLQTVIITTLGGIGGVMFFIFLWERIINLYFKLIHVYLNRFPKTKMQLKTLSNNFSNLFKRSNKNNVSYKRKRKYIKLKNNVGIIGLAILTPLILSIPIGTFITVRFYGRSLIVIMTLSVSIIFFSLLFSFLIYFLGVRY